ncbi:MAG TPA: hypothetical protein VJU18_04135 [Vicinamibacteria bacterium]|nr:hypothetical protein [Vicinamibacteria bacterium]
MRLVLAGFALLVLLACRPPSEAPRFRLVEKGRYQALYGAEGRLLRVLEDRNGDRVADAVVLCGPDGRPRRGEIDTDLDGRVDRWEVLGPDGDLESVGSSPDASDQPQVWQSPPPAQAPR